jgi:hypothetical protein
MGACRSDLVDSRHLEPRHQSAQRHAEWGDARDSSPRKRARKRERESGYPSASFTSRTSARVGGPDQQTGNDVASDFLHELLPKAVRLAVTCAEPGRVRSSPILGGLRHQYVRV